MASVWWINNRIYWLYGFRYWRSSIEQTSELKGKDHRCRMTKGGYNVLFCAVVLLNTVACSLLAIFRSKMLDAICENQPEVTDAKWTAAMEQVCNLLFVLDAVFLTNAILRIKRELAQMRLYVENKRTMFVQTYIMIGHCVIAVAAVFVGFIV